MSFSLLLGIVNKFYVDLSLFMTHIITPSRGQNRTLNTIKELRSICTAAVLGKFRILFFSLECMAFQ